MPQKLKTDIERFAEKIQLDEVTGCWNWIGSAKPNGYGKFLFDGKISSAHRAAYMLFNGEIPDKYDVHHECRNKRCQNPQHLKAITHQENTDHERNKTHCKYGHEFVEGSYYVTKTTSGSGVGRMCKICARIRAHKQRLEKKARAAQATPAYVNSGQLQVLQANS